MAWGGRSLIVFEISQNGKLTLSQERYFNDWIVYGSISPNGSTYFILTAHNSVYEIEYDTSKIISYYTCPEENSILYSGSLFVPQETHSKANYLVAAGTVLDGVIVWDMKSGSVLYNFTSHEGSIFGVRFSDDGKYLLSCSDDRCIKLWDLQTSKEVATGWGHLARIWDIKFYQYTPNSAKFHIISASEDCTSRLWLVDLDKKTINTQRVMEGHLGRNTWCASINETLGIMATGGSDGRVRLWDLKEPQIIDENRNRLTLGSSGKKSEQFKSFKIFQNGGAIVLTTSLGNLYRWDSRGYTKLEIPGTDKKDTYIIMKIWNEIQTVAIAYHDGTCFISNIYDTSKSTSVTNKLKSKLTDIHTWSFNSKYYLLSHSQNPQDDYILTVFNHNDGNLTVEQSLRLAQPESFLPISVEMISDKIILMGSRFGAIVYFNLDYGLERISHARCWRHIFSLDGIRSLVYDQDKKLLHISSRGGHFGVAELVIDAAKDSLSELNIISENKLPKGSIEGCVLLDNGEKVFWGFRNDLFFIWNETRLYEIANERCGGSHRNWDAIIDRTDPSNYKIIYSKESQVMVVDSYKLSQRQATETFGKHTLIQDGTHGREIRAIKFNPIFNKNTRYRIIATASEDTCINIGILDTKTNRLANKCTMRQHISGIQALKWSKDGQYLYSSAGREEFFIWKVKIQENEQQEMPYIYSKFTSAMPPKTDVADLRIMDFDVCPIYLDTDLVTDLTTDLDYQSELIVSVYSDSGIRIWIHSRATGDITLVGTGQYRTCCIFNCNLIICNSHALLLISSTDGHVVGWELTSTLESLGIQVTDNKLTTTSLTRGDFNSLIELGNYIFRLQTHQSSIKDSIIIPASHTIDNTLSSEFYHIGAGDDNSLCLSLLSFSKGISIKKIFQEYSAHSSTITGLAYYIAPGNKTGVISVGVDQNVNLWILEPDSLKKTETIYTTIADTGCIDIQQHDIMIGGLGLSYWSI